MFLSYSMLYPIKKLADKLNWWIKRAELWAEVSYLTKLNEELRKDEVSMRKREDKEA
jgi:hypothetical protein